MYCGILPSNILVIKFKKAVSSWIKNTDLGMFTPALITSDDITNPHPLNL